MEISNSQRIVRLFGSFLMNPKYIYPYCFTSLLNKEPLDVKLPWWSFLAIDFIKTKSDWGDGFEYGSGGSTIFLSDFCRSVVAVEDHLGWHEKVKTTLSDLSIENVEALHRRIDLSSKEAFCSSAYMLSLCSEKDLIIIDGQDEWHPDQENSAREWCFYHAEKYIRPGGCIVVDDSWRYLRLRESHSAKYFKVFESVGPCRKGVTSTDFYFY